MDTVLINPGGQQKIYQALSSKFTAVEPPVWAGLIATYLRTKGHSVSIIDANAESLSPSDVAERVNNMNPVLATIVVYGHHPSASTQTMPGAGAIATALRMKAPDIKRIMVGGHVAALPERTLREEEVDFVSGGEGTETLSALIQALKSGGADQLEEVPGLYYRKNGELARSSPSTIMTDLDSQVPGVAWDLLDMQRYRAHNWHCFGFVDDRSPYASIYTTLGCSFKCTFCCINAPFGGPSYRMRSPQNVVEEIDTLVQKYRVKNLKIADEMFVLNVKHVMEICDLIIERKYDLNIWAYARVDTVRREGLLEKMKKAGFNWLALGIESGSALVRNDIAKSFSEDLIRASVRRLRETGINVCANYIFGLPEDTHETMQDTLDLALNLNAEYSNFYSCMAYPGSALYDEALKSGLPLPDRWSSYAQHAPDALPLPTRHLSGKEVLEFRDKAFLRYFTDPSYLRMIRTRFGEETERHIQEMTSVKLVRTSAS